MVYSTALNKDIYKNRQVDYQKSQKQVVSLEKFCQLPLSYATLYYVCIFTSVEPFSWAWNTNDVHQWKGPLKKMIYINPNKNVKLHKGNSSFYNFDSK